MALVERVHKDDEVAKQVRKEQDELLHGHTDAQQRISLLEGELKKEKGLKEEAKNVCAGLAVEVTQGKAKI